MVKVEEVVMEGGDECEGGGVPGEGGNEVVKEEKVVMEGGEVCDGGGVSGVSDVQNKVIQEEEKEVSREVSTTKPKCDTLLDLGFTRIVQPREGSVIIEKGKRKRCKAKVKKGKPLSIESSDVNLLRKFLFAKRQIPANP